jgi:hypothetical protein
MEFQTGETYAGYEFLDVLKRTKSGIEFRVRNTCLSGPFNGKRQIRKPVERDLRRSAVQLLRRTGTPSTAVHGD